LSPFFIAPIEKKLMPLPKPNKGETKNKFMDRCMANPIMNEDYPDNDQRYAICQSLWKQKREVKAMAVKLNSKGYSNARKLINAGKVDKTSRWSFPANAGNKILGDDNWSEYAKWHLAIDSEAESDTKQYYKYPFGKNGKVYRSALRAIRSRAAQQNVTDVFDTAGRLMEMIDEASNQKLNIERRYMPMHELRATKDNDGNRQIVGLAAVFDKFSENLGGFVERIEQGAFKEALKKSDTRALFNHNSDFVLGRKSAKTLQLKETNEGLAVNISPPDTQFARDLQISIERGDIQGMSFGFKVASNGDAWEETDDGKTIRTISNISEVPDVSVVTFPAYPDTTVALRSLEAWRAIHNISESEIEINPGDDTSEHDDVNSADAHMTAMQRKQELYQRHLNVRNGG
jgi:HK97 family phage prohead protease